MSSSHRKTLSLTPTQQHATSNSKQPRKKSTLVKSRPFCGRFSDCIIMGPVASSHTVDVEKSMTKLEKLTQQVEEMDKELNEEKELKDMYMTKLERSQFFLKYCLQVAQDNGFLDLILTKDKHKEFSLSSPIITNSVAVPQLPSPLQYHPDLLHLVHQAKEGGWFIEPNEVEMFHLSAQGSTADIYKGRWRGLDVAIKCMYPDFFRSNENGVAFFAQEVETLSRQRHPYVLQLMGACFDPPQRCWIITDFFGTDLKQWLHGPGKRQKERTVPLPPLKDRIDKAIEIAQAMQYLHESKPRILHRDLKPSNIFLDNAMHVRIADFGHARYLSDEEKALTGETGTFVYMAPEVIQCCPYDEKCDIYSFSIILNELLTGEYPYIDSKYGPSKIGVEVAKSGFRPTIAKVDKETEAITELIRRSWDQDPNLRPTFAEIASTLSIFQQIE